MQALNKSFIAVVVIIAATAAAAPFFKSGTVAGPLIDDGRGGGSIVLSNGNLIDTVFGRGRDGSNGELSPGTLIDNPATDNRILPDSTIDSLANGGIAVPGTRVDGDGNVIGDDFVSGAINSEGLTGGIIGTNGNTGLSADNILRGAVDAAEEIVDGLAILGHEAVSDSDFLLTNDISPQGLRSGANSFAGVTPPPSSGPTEIFTTVPVTDGALAASSVTGTRVDGDGNVIGDDFVSGAINSEGLTGGIIGTNGNTGLSADNILRGAVDAAEEIVDGLGILGHEAVSDADFLLTNDISPQGLRSGANSFAGVTPPPSSGPTVIVAPTVDPLPAVGRVAPTTPVATPEVALPVAAPAPL